MHQFYSTIVTVFCVLTLAHGSVLKAPPPLPSFFTSGNPFGGGLISSTSSGYSGLVADQIGNAGQTLSLQASGDGLTISLTSDVLSDGITSLVQSGGNAAQGTVEGSDSVVTSEIMPQSTLGLALVGADNVTLELDSYAVGVEEVSSAAEQVAQVTNQQGSGWGVPSGGWGTSLQNGRK